MKLILAFVASLIVSPVLAQTPLNGDWVGGTDVLGTWRFTQARFTGVPSAPGSLDVPGVNTMRMPVESLTTRGSEVRFLVRSPLGPMLFSGRLERDIVKGVLTTPDGRKGTLHLVPRVEVDRATYDNTVGRFALSSGQQLVITYRPFGQLYAVVLEGPDDSQIIKRQLNLIPGGAGWFFTSGSVNAAPRRDEILRFTRSADGKRQLSWEAAGLPTVRGVEAPTAYRQEWVTVRNGAVILNATLFLPAGPGPFPGLVSVGGSGPTTRDAVIVRTQEFVRAGLAVLVYDKRGTGDPSGGPWSTATFETLASDVTAAAAYLATRPEVDPARIGLHGHSQGGWVVPIAAPRIPDVRFVIMTSAPSMGPAEQEEYRATAQARTAKLSESDGAASATLMALKWRVAADPAQWPAYAQALAAAANKPWLQAITAPATADSPIWADMRAHLATSPRPAALAALGVPVLMLFGANDDEVPPRVSADGWRRVFGESGARHLEITEFIGVGHGVFFAASAQGATVRPDVSLKIREWLVARQLVR